MTDEKSITIKMKKILTKDLKDGMRFTDTVYDKKNILLGPNVPMKQKDIERLLKWGILELETAGELIPESLQPEKKIAEAKGADSREAALSQGMFADVIAELGGPASAGSVVLAKKRLTAQMGGYAKRDCELPRSLRGYYQSWLDDMDQLYALAAENYLLDTDDSIRIANEIIGKVQTERAGLVTLIMSRGKKRTYLAVHAVNVAIYAAMLGSRLGLSAQDMIYCVLGCLYIDIGMVTVPSSVFTKEARLSPDEMRKIRAHPLHGYQILVQENGFPKEVGLVTLEHHERTNGQGYSRKLNVGQISEFGRIAAIVDTYTAMTSRRSYREEYVSHEAMRNVLTLGSANFDKQYLIAFLREIGAYPVGTYVRLNNNIIAQVIAAESSQPMRPSIKVLFDEFGDPVHRSEVVHLVRENTLNITKALNKHEVNIFPQQV